MRILALLFLAPAVAHASPQRDIDGDGFDDAVLDHRLLYFGGAKGLVAGTAPAFPRAKPNQPVLFFALEVVGDVNGDGFADVVLGDPACPPYAKDMPQCEVGSASLFLGGPKRLAVKPVQTLTVTGKDTQFGMQVVPLGDVDGDKLADVAIPDRTGVHIYRGTKTGLATTPIDLPPTAIQPVGDLDKDGKIDLLAITPQAATIYYGGDPKRTFAIPIGGDAEFYGSAGSGDFDGDGYGDLAITVEPSSPTGNLVANDVLIYRGSAKGLVTKTKVRFTRDHVRAEFGGVFGSVGDLDGDKRDDLVILATCSQFDDKAGSCEGATAYVYLGGPKGIGGKPVAALAPKRTNFSFSGDAVTALGDIDGDKRPDFALGGYVFRGAAKGGLASTTPPSL
jgi:hypothetical protein